MLWLRSDEGEVLRNVELKYSMEDSRLKARRGWPRIVPGLWVILRTKIEMNAEELYMVLPTSRGRL